jgi:hypothetical protein
MTYQPTYPERHVEPSTKWRDEGVWRPGFDPPAADLPVLVSTAKFTQRRHGSLGLSKRGRTWLLRAAETLQEKPGRTAMITGTFSRKQLELLAQPGCLATFHRYLVENLCRELAKVGLPAWVCLVWEEQPKRTAREGLPGMHYHALAPYRTGAGRRPLVSLKAWKHCHTRALRASTGYDGAVEANGVRVEAVRTTCSRYLTSYLKKPALSPEHWIGGEWGELVPRHWWAVSGDLKKAILSEMRQWSDGFRSWVGRNGHWLRAAGLITTFAVHTVLRISPTWRIYFRDRSALRKCSQIFGLVGQLRHQAGDYGGWLGMESATLDALSTLGLYLKPA